MLNFSSKGGSKFRFVGDFWFTLASLPSENCSWRSGEIRPQILNLSEWNLISCNAACFCTMYSTTSLQETWWERIKRSVQHMGQKECNNRENTYNNTDFSQHRTTHQIIQLNSVCGTVLWVWSNVHNHDRSFQNSQSSSFHCFFQCYSVSAPFCVITLF